MRIHHLNCGTLCPHGARLINGKGGLLEAGRVVCHCLLIETGDGLVLLDTGFGTEDTRNPRQLGPFFAMMRPRAEIGETALKQVEDLGFAAGDVRQIVTTHLDPDHSGGLPDFPQAEVHVFGRELDAAMSPRLRDRPRYLAAHWKHNPQWVRHDGEGDEWFGFGGVRILPDLGTEVLLIPLAGHSLGHTGVAIKAGDRWLLHCGDAYFHHDEVASPPACPPGLRFFQLLNAADGKRRRANQERLRELVARHGEEVRLLCSHDPHELDLAQAAGASPSRGVSNGGPEKLWEPSAELVERSRLREYMDWLEAERGLQLSAYDELWRWSVDDLEGFWSSIWDFFGVQADGDYERVLGSSEMPGAEWFAGTSLNYAEHVFAGTGDDAGTAILHASELRDLSELSWRELRSQVAATAAGLRALGVRRGDRVVAYMPNVPEAIVAFLASASIGAIWSSCSPDFGPASVIDRFAQIEPKVLFAVDGYRYGGKDFDRRETLAQLQAAMPSLVRTVVLPYLDADPGLSGLRDATRWDELLAGGEGADLTFERLPFDHPLWVLYSSGTTGLPKAIVQSQGGILLEHLKKLNLHVDAHPGDRLFWFTTTGWMMWNFLVSGLLTRAAIVLYDGNPGHPDMGVLWDLAERAEVTMFGTSASYIAACMKAGVEPGAGRDLSRLGAVGSTGSPLSPEGFDWIYEQLGADTWLFSTSGGTDLCTAFVGGCALLPVYRGELQARALGAAVEAWDEDGNPVIDEVGELVVTEPMPSMPVFFWDDDEAQSRYRASYFEYYPGVWRHGDWIEITSRGTAVIYGRSDSTINRSGIRMGTSEIYRAVLGLDEIVDALVVDIPRPGTEGWMPLFVVLREGAELNDELRREIARRVRSQCSPRHVPDEVFQIAEVPRTLSGKALEVPVKRILTGTPPEQAASRDSLANPAALDYFVELAGSLDEGPRPA